MSSLLNGIPLQQTAVRSSNDYSLNKKYAVTTVTESFLFLENRISLSELKRASDSFSIQRYKNEVNNLNYAYGCQELNKGNYEVASRYFHSLFCDTCDSDNIGSIMAGIKIAQMYFWGEGCEKDKHKALKIINTLLNTGNPLVLAWLSDYFRMGIPNVVVKDKVLSKKIYDICVENLTCIAVAGDQDAQYFLGFCLLYGINCIENKALAFKYIQNAADRNNIHAKIQLAECYLNGWGCQKDVPKGICMTQSFNTSEFYGAQYKLGLLYYLDKYESFIKKDVNIALRYFINAGKQGHKLSQSYIGDIYYYGEGVETDYSVARKWYELSAEQGSVHSLSQLGFIYIDEDFPEHDDNKAFFYFKKAADQGHSNSQYMLHYFYFEDSDFKDYNVGKSYLEKAAEQGHLKAQKLLSEVYAGQYGFYDPEKCLEWLIKAAEQEDAESERMVAQSYAYSGDTSTAIKWYTKAAEHDDIIAQIDLAEYYIRGIDVNTDIKIGFDLMSRVQEKFNPESIESEFSNISQYLYTVRKLADLYYTVDQEHCILNAGENAFFWYFTLFMITKEYDNIFNLDELLLINLGSLRFLKYIWDKQLDEKISQSEFDFLLFSVLEHAERESKLSNISMLLGKVYASQPYQDIAKSIKWYSIAKERNNILAYYPLALCYINFQNQSTRGFLILSEGARQGNSDCMYGLGQCYQKGIGSFKNDRMAKKWYRMAADKGNRMALEELQKLK